MKTETKHTPGPWSANGTHIRYQKNAGGYRFDIAEVFRDVGASTAKENAQLIAAAPELLEALQMCVDFIKRAHGGENMTEDERWALLDNAQLEARAAIAKAEGK